MPAVPKLTPEQWASLRVEYEAGGASNLALAQKYGVSEKAIRKRAADTTQPGGAWRRGSLGPSVQEAAHRAATRVARAEARKKADLAGDGPSEGPNDGPNGEGPSDDGPSGGSRSDLPVPLKPSYRYPSIQAMADPAMRAAMREEIIEGVAEALAKANSDHLEHRVGPLKGLYRQLLKLLMEAMTTPDPDDREAVERQARAQAALIVGRSDTLGSHLQALIKMAESIQNQERRALGVDDRAKRVELSGPGGAPIQAEYTPVLDLTRLSTEQMQLLFDAAQLMEGGRERPPIPLPPGSDEPPAG